MGNCCGNEEEAKPLLGGSGPLGVRSGTLSEASHTTVTQPPTSARQNRPIDRRDFETSIELIATIELKPVPIVTLDKTFKDISRLYNDVVECFRCLEIETHKFKEYFVEETSGIPVLASCVRLLVRRCDGAKITIERKSSTFIEISYDAAEVSKRCYGNPENVLPPLEHYKKACRYIRDILAHAPQVQSNTSIVLNDEDTLRKDILKADLPPEVSQQAMRNFLDNVSKLRTSAAGTDTIKRDVEKKFKEFSKASEGFFPKEEVL